MTLMQSFIVCDEKFSQIDGNGLKFSHKEHSHEETFPNSVRNELELGNVDPAHGGINMERLRGVNCIKTGGGRTLCTLHRGEGLYG